MILHSTWLLLPWQAPHRPLAPSLLSRLLRIFLSGKIGLRFRVACWMKRAWIQQLDSQECEFGVGMKKVADKSVVCHKMNYPYAVFYCHTFTKTRTYMIPLVGVDGSKSKAMAACHSDTSAWHPQHVAFQVLKIKPGTVPVCHFLHNIAMVWIPKYIKEGSTVSAMGVVQRNENVVMIVPPPEPFPTGCQWAKCILPASLEGIVLRCEDTSKIDVIPV